MVHDLGNFPGPSEKDGSSSDIPSHQSWNDRLGHAAIDVIHQKFRTEIEDLDICAGMIKTTLAGKDTLFELEKLLELTGLALI